jgi:hypothetical protein
MADPKHQLPSRTQGQTDTPPQGERRRLSRIVHDHKGNAIVQWYDAPADYERPVFEIEDTGPPAKPTGKELHTGSLSVQSDDLHNPYMHIPEGDRKRAPGQRTDLRKLSAWIKMVRELEEAKKRNRDDED